MQILKQARVEELTFTFSTFARDLPPLNKTKQGRTDIGMVQVFHEGVFCGNVFFFCNGAFSDETSRYLKFDTDEERGLFTARVKETWAKVPQAFIERQKVWFSTP